MPVQMKGEKQLYDSRRLSLGMPKNDKILSLYRKICNTVFDFVLKFRDYNAERYAELTPAEIVALTKAGAFYVWMKML